MRRRTEASTRYTEGHTSTYVATCPSLSTFVLRRDLMGIWINVACILLFITAFSTEGLATEINRNINASSITNFCYVCLSPEKSSEEVKDALLLSFHETQQQIPNCAKFALNFSTDFILPCPSKYLGCQIQIYDAKESCLCAHFSLNDFQKAKKMENCYCIICRAEQTHHSLKTTKLERKSKKVWQSSETDDEDLLKEPFQYLNKIQDDIDVGSGEWEPPPGVILLETTTPKPTLIPNLRPESRTTTPISTNGVANFSIRLDIWLVVSVLSVVLLI